MIIDRGNIMEETGRRMTRQKKLIMEILEQTKSHPAADWIYQQAKKVMPEISLGTVYRNLKILSDQGDILELQYGSSFNRYDANPRNHYHFVCEKCHNVYDVDLPPELSLETRAEEALGCRVRTHRLEFYGECSNCLEKSRQI